MSAGCSAWGEIDKAGGETCLVINQSVFRIYSGSRLMGREKLGENLLTIFYWW
jgi:hypothetical protein